MIKIGIIGDFDPARPSHIATNDALNHSADYLKINIEIEWIPTESLENDMVKSLRQFDGLWCAPGSPYKSMNGAINAIRFARENDYPFIGTCGGYQHAVIEFARNKLGLAEAQQCRINPEEANLFISSLSCTLIGEREKLL